MTRVRTAASRLARAHTRIAVRLLLFNLLLVFLPAAGLLYLDAYEQHLLDQQERSMADAGRLVAAIVSQAVPGDEAAAGAALQTLAGRTDLRIRLIALDGRVLADAPAGPGDLAYADAASGSDRSAWLYRIGSWLWDRWRSLAGRGTSLSTADAIEIAPGRISAPEVERAIATGYGAATRLSAAGARSVTLFVAVPARSSGGELRVVLLSQTTGRILQRLYEVRLRIFQVVVISVVVAVVVTAVGSLTIVRPVRRLRDDAEAMAERRGGLRRRFHGIGRQDEIGELARAVDDLTRRFEDHLRSSAQFAADVTHELRNPLASIRASVEMLATSATPEDRDRFRGRIERDIGRLELLLSELREATTIEALLEQETRGPVDASALVRQFGADLDGAVRVHVTAAPVVLTASADRLTQLLHALVDNARSFSPPGAPIDVDLATGPGAVKLTVRDRGPGIPPEHLSRVFQRFFTHRPGQAEGRQRHTGLGLSIAASIARSYGGTIEAGNHADGGAVITVTLPGL